MSLDIHLYETVLEPEPCYCAACGNEHTGATTRMVYDANITHNLGKMAVAAGIYDCVWRPDENGITTASQLIEPLKRALVEMKADSAKFKVFEPYNKWGTYEDFVPWLERLLEACEEHPDATIEVSR